MTCHIERRMRSHSKLFEFYALTYPIEQSPGYMRGEYLTARASSEHAARRSTFKQCRARGRFIYTLEPIDTHADGGPPGRA